jgi:uncharacterized cupin superfamily protein
VNAADSPAAESPAADNPAPPGLAAHVPDAELEPEPLDPAQILAGNPRTSAKVLWRSPDGRSERGIWQITPGTVTDTEADEFFVVTAGRATIAIEDGPTLEVGPGDAVTLAAGARTRWTVHETLRKAYHLTVE